MKQQVDQEVDISRRPRRRRSDLLLLVMLSGVFNVFLTGVFLYFSGAAAAPWDHPAPRASAKVTGGPIASSADPLALSRLMRSDIGSGFGPSPEVQAQKSSLTVSTVFAGPAADENGSATADLSSDADVSVDGMTTEESRGMSVPPILRKAGGRVEIGSFKTLTFVASGSECLDFGRGILQDVNAPASLLNVMAESKAITIAKICAANGSVVMTCRNDQITISPRPPRPDDKCGQDIASAQ